MKSIRPVLLLLTIAVGCSDLKVPGSAEEVTPLDVGETIPDVILQNAFGHEARLMSMASENPMLLIFYRGGWCPYCNAHLSSLAEIEDELYDMEIRIVAVSPDQPVFLKESTLKHELGYQLLSDGDMNAAKRFGLAYKVDPETVNRYKESGLDFAGRAGFDHYMLPVPAAFLIDTGGTIRYRYFNPDYTVRAENDELLKASRELVAKQEL